jgi:hypothetical protein
VTNAAGDQKNERQRPRVSSATAWHAIDLFFRRLTVINFAFLAWIAVGGWTVLRS